MEERCATREGHQQNYAQEEGANSRIGQKLRAKPRDHIQRSHWLPPSEGYAYAHARTITINTPALQQTSFSNASKRTSRCTIKGRFDNYKKVCTIHDCNYKNIYLDAKLAIITCSTALSRTAISFNSHPDSKRSSTTTTTKVCMTFTIVTRQITTCIYTDNKHMSLIYVDDKQTSLDIPTTHSNQFF